MRILFLSTHFNTGGITSYLLTLSQGLVDHGHQVYVATSGGDCVSELERFGAKHIPINIRTKSELSPKLYLALPELKKIIRQNSIDIIHAQTRVTQVAAFFLFKMTGVPYVATCHGFFKPRFSRRIFPCWGERTIAVSEAVREHLCQDFKLKSEGVTLVPNGIDLKKFSVLDSQTKKEKRLEFNLGTRPVIGIIARLSDVKGQDILIRAIPKIALQIPEVKLMIVGVGKMEKELKDLVAQLKLEDQVGFYPIVNQTAAMLSLFDIFVMPSRQEGLGLSVLEAQAAGLPVVASKVGGLPSLIEDGVTGLLVPPENPELLAEAILVLLKNLDHAKQMGEKARAFVQNKFSADIMVEDTLLVYGQIVSVVKP